MSLVKAFSANLWVGGQPLLSEFAELQKAGLTHVINLRPDNEMQGFNEADYVQLLGLTYYHLPIASGADLTAQMAEQFDQALQAAPGPVLVHCASGNRVGALFALRAFYQQGHSADAALEIGRSHGLTHLTPMVQALFAQASAE